MLRKLNNYGETYYRQIGSALFIVGLAGIFLPILVDLLGNTAYDGIGPTQRRYLIYALLPTFLGISLWSNNRRVAYILIGLTVVVYIGYFWVYSHYAYRLFLFPFDYDQGEGFELVDTLLFSQGKLPYRSNNAYPFYSSNYPPVFHLVIVPLVWLFGTKYWTGRLIGYLGTLITAAAIGYAVQREGKRWWVSLVVGLAYLASNFIYHVGPLFRQHLFMVMFETLTVVLLTVVIERERQTGTKQTKGFLWIMLLLLLAGYTKQLAYATVVAVFLTFFWHDWRRSIRWAIPFALVTGAIFLALNLATHGEWMLATVTANINEFIPGQTKALYQRWYSLHRVLIWFSSITILVQLWRKQLTPYAIWFVVTVINSATAGKWGAGESYFATTIAAGCILTGLGINDLIQWSEQQPYKSRQLATLTIIPLLLLYQADQFFHMPTHTPLLKGIARSLARPTETWVAPQTSCSPYQEPEPIPFVDVAFTLVGRPPTPTDTDAGIRITQAIAQAGDSSAFAEDAGFNLYLGRDVVTNPTQLLNLYKNNAVDLTQMQEMLTNQAFDSVVLRAQFYPPPILEVIGQQYEQTDLIQMNGFVYCVLQPKKP